MSMGMLRFILSLGVILEHINLPIIIGSYSSIKAFFIISGFYMALISDQNHYSIKHFYISRMLRIFPLYFIILFISLIFYGLLNSMGYRIETFISIRDVSNVHQALHLTLSNLIILGSDMVWFNGLGTQHLIVPPIWSLALELYFYALVPILVKIRTRNLIVIIMIFELVRIITYTVFSLNEDPFHARFFLFEIPVFILGILSYRIYITYKIEIKWVKWWSYFSLIFLLSLFNMLASAFNFPDVYGKTDYIQTYILLFILTLLLPPVFELTKNSKLDKLLGEFSFPAYLIHYVLIVGLYRSDSISRFQLIVLTYFLSAICLVLVIRNVDHFRHNRFRNNKFLR